MRSGTILTGALTLAFCLAGTARADEDKGRKKGTRGGNPGVITIDASKLPPDLLKQLLKYSGEGKKPGKKGMPAAKGPQKGKKGGPRAHLPPGLRNKVRRAHDSAEPPRRGRLPGEGQAGAAQEAGLRGVEEAR